jgi:pyruvate, orthophosphate dikinase
MPGMMDTVLNIGLNDETAEGLITHTQDPRFVYDAYRRLIQMFGAVVMGIPDQAFEEAIERARRKAGVATDAGLTADDWRALAQQFKTIFRSRTQVDFPQDPVEQLKMATEAVFKSWNGKRAMDYRNAAGIAHDLGTAVNIVAMVFGNMGEDCATGVAMTRNGATGAPKIEGDYLINAQGEDVVAGIRMTKDIEQLANDMPEAYHELQRIAATLEKHYRDMQDIEFTIEKGKLWMLQTRDGKRTAQAAVRIAVDMQEDGLISKEEAVARVAPEQIDFFLHHQFDNKALSEARAEGKLLARGLNVSPGAAFGVVAFDADLAETWAKEQGKPVIMVRPETKPDDVHGMLAAKGILTSRGGRTSHAALVARQFGKPAVVGVAELAIDLNKRRMVVGERVIQEGDWLSLDGNTGEVFMGQLKTMVPDIRDLWLIKLLNWADEIRTLGVWANADYPADAQRAREYGAQGIGLCRSEHMFFESERLPYVQQMIMANLPIERREALKALLPFQREDFVGLFRKMDGLPVIIRLIDPPLHEFLPDLVELINELADLKMRIKHAPNLAEVDNLLQQIRNKERIRAQVERLSEKNPMLGMRGVRLGIQIPEVTIMQVRAIFEAACEATKEDIKVFPKVMIPLTSHANELQGTTGSTGGRGQESDGRTGHHHRLQVRHHDRVAPGRRDRRPDRRVRPVFLLWDQRPDPDHLWYFPGRRRGRFSDRLHQPGHSAGQPLRHTGPRRGCGADAHRGGQGPAHPARSRVRHLRGTWRRPGVHRHLPRTGPRLCFVLAVPRPHRPAGSGCSRPCGVEVPAVS